MFKYFLLAGPLALCSCKVLQSPNKVTPEIKTSLLAPPPPPEETTAIVSSVEPTFCNDSIYGEYLQKKSRKEAKQRLRLIKDWSTRRKFRRNISHFSRHQARIKLAHDNVQDIASSFPVVLNDRVEKWIHYFEGRGRITFMKWLVRREHYRQILIPLLRQEGVPEELEFLAMIESGFNNRAYSRARATGTWQFMAGTARLYGLNVNYWMDERRDPVKSTVAAARYLKDLYANFDDWYLAISAYNAGPGKIRRAIRKLKTRDFWKIANSRYIRSETKNYVPKMLAALIIASEPEKHGFQVVPNLHNFTPTTSVAVKRPARIDEIANKVGIPKKLLRQWNPELIKGITPPLHRLGGKSYPLRIPASHHSKFAAVADSLAELEIRDVKMHKIRRGETLSKIARTYRVPVKKILRMNPKLHPRRLRPGKRIAIPIPAIVTKKTSDTA